MQSPETGSIEIVVNGENRRIPADLTVSALLLYLEIDLERVAIEKDRRIVRRPDWSATPIGPGAQLEIVQFVGGG